MTKKQDGLDKTLERLRQQLLYEGRRLNFSEEHATKNSNLYIEEAKSQILSKYIEKSRVAEVIEIESEDMSEGAKDTAIVMVSIGFAVVCIFFSVSLLTGC